jgi:hypothetical protein
MTQIPDFLGLKEILYKYAQKIHWWEGFDFVGDTAMIFLFQYTSDTNGVQGIS